MNKKLYPNGSERKSTGLKLLISFLYISTVTAIILTIVDFIVTFFADRGSMVYWGYTIIWAGFYGVILFGYWIRLEIPILGIKNNLLIFYKGFFVRDKVSLEDIKFIETEFHPEDGLQLLLTLKSNNRYYAELPDNSCSTKQFSAFFRKYVPRIKIKSDYRLTPDVEANKKEALDVGVWSEDALFSKLKIAQAQGNDEFALRILHCLEKKGYIVQGFMADIYLNAGGDFNDKRALKLYREGYDRGSQHAAVGLAVMYYHGIEVKEDKKRAYEYLKFAEGYRDAQRYYYLGLLHMDGIINGRINEETASFYFKKAVAYGSADGYLGLAMISGKKKQYCKTFKLGLKHIKAEQLS